MRCVFSLLALLPLALAVRAGGPGGEKVDIRGQVTAVTPLKGKLLGSVRIEGVKEKDTGYDKAVVKVTAATRVFKAAGGKRVPAKFEDVKVGSRVQARFTGRILESYPVQTTADWLVILEAK